MSDSNENKEFFDLARAIKLASNQLLEVMDPNDFQYTGHFEYRTNSSGQYVFRTVLNYLNLSQQQTMIIVDMTSSDGLNFKTISMFKNFHCEDDPKIRAAADRMRTQMNQSWCRAEQLELLLDPPVVNKYFAK